MTAISSRGASSSSFTISWPRRAVVFQCTFRSDSPCSYSRTEWRSKPEGRRSSSRRPSCAWAPLSEKSRSRTDEPRVDEQRSARIEVDVQTRKPERIVDRRARLLDDVAAARHALEHVACLGSRCRRGTSVVTCSPKRAIVSVIAIPAAGIRDSGWTSRLTQTSSPSSRAPLPARRRSCIGPAASQTSRRARRAARARARSRPGRAPWRRRATRRRTSPHPAAASASPASSRPRPGRASARLPRRRSPRR